MRVSEFEFFMAFYGLMLGLAVAELFGGFANILKEQRLPRVGLILPLVGVIALVEFVITFIDAWVTLREVSITLMQLALPTLIALTYFGIAAILVPRNFEAWPDLDVYFDRRRAWIVGLFLLANLLLIGVELFTRIPLHVADGDWARIARYVGINLWLIGSYVVLLLSRKRWLDIGAALSVIALYLLVYLT